MIATRINQIKTRLENDDDGDLYFIAAVPELLTKDFVLSDRVTT